MLLSCLPTVVHLLLIGAKVAHGGIYSMSQIKVQFKGEEGSGGAHPKYNFALSLHLSVRGER